MRQREFRRLRKIALALPEVNERFSHGAPCFYVRDNRPFCRYHDNHRGDGRLSLWFRTSPGVQDILVDPGGGQFFRPMASASGTFRDWVGVLLALSGEHEVDWAELAVLIEDSYRLVAPRQLVAELDNI